MSKITILLDRLGRQRKLTQKAYDEYKAVKELEDITRDDLSNELHAIGLTSAKTKDFTATLAQRVNIEVMHEPSVIDWIKHQPNLEADLYIGLKKSAFDPIAKVLLKNTGELIPGTATIIKEYVSLRDNRKDKK